MEELYRISDTYDAKSNSDLIIRRKIVPSVRCKDATNTYIKEEISLENPILNDPENRRKFPEKELNREIVNEIIAAEQPFAIQQNVQTELPLHRQHN